MKSVKRILGAAVAAILVGGSAHAATLYTSAAEAPYVLIVGETMYCTVVNAQTTPVTVSIETIDYNGFVVNAPPPMTVQPDQGFSITGTGNSTYCKFIVSGSAKSVVAQAVYARTSDHRYTVAVPAQ
jgi:hypothetical protein